MATKTNFQKNLLDINSMSLSQKMEIITEIIPRLMPKKYIEIGNIIINNEPDSTLKQMKDGLRANLATMSEVTINSIYVLITS